MNHLIRDSFVFSNIVPTRHEKFFLHFLQRNLPSVLVTQWCSPQYGHTISPSLQRLSMIACLHCFSLLKYDVSDIILLNFLKFIILFCFCRLISLAKIQINDNICKYFLIFFLIFSLYFSILEKTD